MKIKKISEDEVQGARMVFREILNPSESDVLLAFDRLDGKKFSSTMFFVDDENFMSIGGGAAHYVVFVAEGVDQKIFTLTSFGEDVEGVCDVVVGGQAGSYPKKHCVSKEVAQQALMYFSKSGGVSSELVWDIDS